MSLSVGCHTGQPSSSVTRTQKWHFLNEASLYFSHRAEHDTFHPWVPSKLYPWQVKGVVLACLPLLLVGLLIFFSTGHITFSVIS
jgi:hypothetical protein